MINPAAIKKMLEADFSEQHSEARGFSQEDRRFLSMVEKGISRCPDGHYEMPLPCKEKNLELPNNYELALRPLIELKRFLKDEQDYVTFMNDVIAKGYVEKVIPIEAISGKKVWFIPHHGVYHPKKQ